MLTIERGVSDHYRLFFFQAEDGIRDLTVTGVQTCALPISLLSLRGSRSQRSVSGARSRAARALAASAPRAMGRSEERRVGKECRSWGLMVVLSVFRRSV